MPEPAPDPRRRLAVIDPADPLLAEFAYQHDLRERFLCAISDAIIELNAAVAATGRPSALLRHASNALDTLSEAVDPAAIDTWIHEGRPLPSIDGVVQEQGNQLDRLMRDILDA